MLRAFLEFAASGGRNLGRDGTTSEPLNLFEEQVASALEARGIPLVPQYGASRFRIDLVAKHPQRPGRLVLAIECDGATYHSSPTARDRDRLRQQHLEALGWRFHRIWSADWFLNPEQGAGRAVHAYQDAVAFADRVDSGGSIARPPAKTAVPMPVPEPRVATSRPAIAPGLAIDSRIVTIAPARTSFVRPRSTVAIQSWSEGSVSSNGSSSASSSSRAQAASQVKNEQRQNNVRRREEESVQTPRAADHLAGLPGARITEG